MYALQPIKDYVDRYGEEWVEKFQYRKRYVRVATEEPTVRNLDWAEEFQYRKRYVRVATA